MDTKMSGLQLKNNSIGERTIQGGSYDHLRIFGSLHGVDANIEKLTIRGEATLENCTIHEMSVAGEAVLKAGKAEHVEVFGELKAYGHVDFDTLHVQGGLQCEDASCQILCYGKTGRKHFKKTYIKGKISMATLKNFYPLALTREQHCKDILNFGRLYSQELIECVHFFSFSSVVTPELNADFAYLYPSTGNEINEFHGALLIVDPHFDSGWLKDIKQDAAALIVKKNTACHMVHIHCIEADEVVLDYVKCERITADKVVLGPHCEVAHVTYRNACEIHPQAHVKECTKL